jgi:hypothetical protein
MTEQPKLLPPGVVASDLKYPECDSGDRLDTSLGDGGHLTFYEVEGRRVADWCIATLLIGTASRVQRSRGVTTDRTYAVRISDGGCVRIGLGPHIKRTVTVYIRKSRAEALKKYADLYTKGAIEANQIRDRISSRRAQGQLERAAGHHSWTWDS